LTMLSQVRLPSTRQLCEATNLSRTIAVKEVTKTD
jgi:hypothetical protein